MTFDAQDARELMDSALGEEVRITFKDDTIVSLWFLGYDETHDLILTNFGALRRVRIANIVVLDRMDAIIERACETGWVR